MNLIYSLLYVEKNKKNKGLSNFPFYTAIFLNLSNITYNNINKYNFFYF